MSFCLVRPGGLHAVYIRSALPAVQVYEQTVTGLGLSQTQSAGSRRGRERGYSMLKQIECEWVNEWVILHPFGFYKYWGRSLSISCEESKGWVHISCWTARNQYRQFMQLLLPWPTNSLSDSKSYHLVIPLLNRKQNLNSFAKNVILKCRIKICRLQFIVEFSMMYIHLDRQEVRISSPPDLPGWSKTKEK